MIIKEAQRLQHIKEYYFSVKLKEIASLLSKGKDIINLGIGNPDQAPARSVLEKLSSETMAPGNHGYQSYRGLPELRDAFSKWYGTHFKVSLNPENEVLPLIGSKEGIMHISMAFLNKGDKVLIPNPGYPTYRAASLLAGAEVHSYSLKEYNNWIPDFEALEKTDLTKVKIMWVNYPHMPTGTKGTKSLFEKLIKFGHKHQILICNDNPYSFILNDQPQSILEIDGSRAVALELNSLSKSHHMAGWRIGMVAGRQDYIQAVLKFKSNMDSGMFHPVQKAAIEALSLPKEWHQDINEKIYTPRRIIVEKILQSLNCRYQPKQIGMFVWARIPKQYKDSYELSDKLLYQSDVFITPGGIFGTEGEKYVRISLCASEEKLSEAHNRIQTHLKKSEEATLKMQAWS